MQIVDGRPIYSATDLNNFLACEHLTTLELAVLRGETKRPERSGQSELLSQLGEEHEQNYLRELTAGGGQVTTIERVRGASLEQAAADTEAAMARGDAFIYQATFFDDGWVGHTDFLRKVPTTLPGGRWAWHYEVEDTKLARHTEPYFLLQLAYYSEHVARVQGAAAEHMHVVLGNGTRATYRVEDCMAYYRDVRKRFLAHLADAVATYPRPVSHCGLCVWSDTCEQRWKADDHLSLVANITGLQTTRLNESGIRTLRSLAAATPEQCPPKMSTATFAKLERQARLQEEQRIAVASGEEYPYRYEFLETGLKAPRGFFHVPKPSSGDVFFDMEGDPYYEIGTGLEYLFGAYTVDGGFTPFWGCDRSPVPTGKDRLAERRAFEAFIDFVMARLAADPEMHIYHYASYEKTALGKLALRHATREDEVDVLLRQERLIDLYTVVRQALVVGQPGYSIKYIEDFYGKRGSESGVKAGDESILRFEEWLALRGDPKRRDDGVLDDLQRYNEYDCVSTHGLREWLIELRANAERQFTIEIPPYAGKDETPPKPDPKNAQLKADLEAKLPPDFDPESDDPAFVAVRPYFLARHLLEYHWREDKPVHWRFHDRCERHLTDPIELVDDSESIIGLERISGPTPVKKSVEYTFCYAPQLHKLDVGDDCYDLETKEKAGEITALEDGDERGHLVLRRGPSLANVALPAAITVRSIVPASSVLAALVRFSDALLAGGVPFRYRAAYDVLMNASPRLRGMAAGATIQPDHPDETALRALCDALDESYLFIQGPPGSGKTYAGARLIVDLLVRGKKVGITANSHKAIHNLLDEVVLVAVERGVSLAAQKKVTKADENTYYNGAGVANIDGFQLDRGNLFAGTAWAFGVAAMDQQLDYLFVDEAGQVSLPHAIAVMTSARNTIFLGDPLQLSQVAHTQHPGNVGASVLEHLLDRELRPVATDRGVLLTDSYRMHPDVCGFISELLYEGKLRSAAGRELQDVTSPGLSGTGLRYIPVPHRGNSQRSDEEAECIANELDQLMRGTIRDSTGVTRKLEPADAIVVTPYNAQVRAIRRTLDARGFNDVEVGTVDKFQGREAYVVFYSTAASSPEDASKGIGFVFDRQRFNVAISRARALAIMVGSPDLLVQRCTSVEDVFVANGVCRFVDEARKAPAPA
jgi:predicted RecB family nuclease